MPIPWAPIITGGAALLGGILGNKSRQSIADNTNALTADQFNRGLDFNREMQESLFGFNESMMLQQMGFNKEEAALQRQWSAGQANINRDWLERMRATQHQTQVKDLRAAGLNPILSANSGAGVPASPSAAGMAASAQAASGAMQTAPSSGQFVQAGYQHPISNAVEALGAMNQTKQTDANVSKIQQEVENLKVDLHLKDSQMVELGARASKLIADADLTRANLTGQQIKNRVNSLVEKFIASSPGRAFIADKGVTRYAAAKAMKELGELEVKYGKSFDDLGNDAVLSGNPLQMLMKLLSQ